MHDYCKHERAKKLRFRDWLKQKLDNKEVEGVEWIDRRRGLFKIPWKRFSHKCLIYKDAKIFEQWAIYSGKYRVGEQPIDPVRWKTNFRCVLNTLPDFREVRERNRLEGPNAYKVYVMRNEADMEAEKKAEEEKPFGRKVMGSEADMKAEKKAGGEKEYWQVVDSEVAQILDNMMRLSRRPVSAFPAFETLLIERSRENDPQSSFVSPSGLLAAWNAVAVDQFVNKPANETEDEEDDEDDNDDDDDAFTEDEVNSEQEIIDLVNQMDSSSEEEDFAESAPALF